MSNDAMKEEQANHCPQEDSEASSREELLVELAHCLKKRREAENLTVDEIALSLKLRAVYIQALESGDWRDMPGEVYALGFLKQYASYLHVDVSDSIEKLKTGHYKLTKPLTFPDPSIAPNKTWVIIAALSFVVLIILFNLFDDGRSSAPTIQQAELSDVQSMTETETDTSATESVEQESPGAAEVELQAKLDTPSQDAATQNTLAEGAVHKYRLTAVGEDVWLQLTVPTATGDVEEEARKPLLLREVLLHAGESMTFNHNAPYLLLTCGNPVALQVEIDGETTIAAGSLGESGKVLRNFTLRPNS